MNLLLDPGMLPVKRLEKAFEHFSLTNRLFLISKWVQTEKWKNIDSKFNSINYYDFDKQFFESFPKSLNEKYLNIIASILNDHRTILIAERVNKIKKWKSIHNSQKEIEKLVFNMISMLIANRINCVLFQATPHGIYEWLLGKTAEGLGIRVLIIQTSPIPWRYWVIEGIDKQDPLKVSLIHKIYKDKYLERFVESNLLNYSEAIPDYELQRIKCRKGNYWSWQNELKYVIRNHSLGLVKNMIYKYRLFKRYNSLCTTHVKNSNRNIVYFMHYQPERTSLPEGKLYTQQWLLIRALSIYLPEGWVLYVKEHPSIFTNTKFDRRYRDIRFYSDINQFKNVRLLPVDTDTFDLIDNSEAIATLTGTVGVQSLVRGRPVLAFGHASYRNMTGVFNINNLSDLNITINEIKKVDNKTITEQTKNYLNKIIDNTISCYDTNIEDSNFSFYKSMNRIEGHLILLEKMLYGSNLESLINNKRFHADSK